MLNTGSAKKIGKILAIIAASMITLLVILLFSVGILLHSPGSQAWLLAKLAGPLAKAGIQWSFQDFSIHLLKHISFDQLRLELTAPMPAQGKIELETFRLRYSLAGLTSRHLAMHEVTVVGMRGDLVLQLPESTKEEEEPETSGEPFDLAKLFRSPRATVTLEKLSIKDINLKIKLSSPHITGDLLIDDLAIEAAFDLVTGRIAGQWSATLPIAYDIAISDPEQSLKTSGKLALDHRGQLLATGDEERWQTKLEVLQSGLQLQDFQLQRLSAGESQTVSLRSLAFETLVDIEKTDAPFPKEPGLGSYLPLYGLIQGKLGLEGLQLQVKTPEVSQEIQLERLSSNWRFSPHIVGFTEALDLQGEGVFGLELGPLAIRQGGQRLVDLPLLSLNFAITSQGNDPKGQLDLKLSKLRLPDLKTDIDLQQNLQWTAQIAPLQLAFQGQTEVNQMKLVSLQVGARDLEKNMLVEINTDLHLPERLKTLHDGAAILSQTGELNLSIKQNLQLKHEQPVWESEWSDWQQIELGHQLRLSLKQKTPSGKALFRSSGLETQLDSQLLRGHWHSRLDLQGRGLRHEAINRAVDLQQKLDIKAKLTEPLAMQLSAGTQLDGQQVMQIEAKLADEASELKLDYQLQADITPQLSSLMDALNILDQLGSIRVTLQQDLLLQHQAASIAAVDFASPDYRHDISTKLRSQVEIDSKKAKEKPLVRLDQPMRLESNVRVTGMAIQAQSNIQLAQVTLPDTMQVDQIHLATDIKVNHLETLQQIDADVDFRVNNATVLMDIPDRDDINGLLRDIKGKIRAKVWDQKLVNLETFQFSMADPLLVFQGVGGGSAEGSGNFQGGLKIQLPGQVGQHTQLRGEIEVPVSVALFDQNSISLLLTPRFKQVEVSNPSIKLQGLDGNLVIREELRLRENGSIDFLFYENHNPFARVDYDSVEPLVADRNLLSIENIAADHLQVGPLVTSIEIRQNMILLNDLRVNLLDGSALGRMYLNLNPVNPQIGFLGRFTQLDPRLLLPPEQRVGKRAGDIISGRSALVFDIRQRLATGRMDITSIGRQQLLRFIDLIDPNFEDPQLGAARKALYVAYPRKVAIDMDQGLMDLEIELGGTLTQTISVRSLPLTPLIMAHADEPLRQIEKILSDSGDDR